MSFMIFISLMVFFSISSSVSAGECNRCHPIPQDSSHKIHSSGRVISPLYGDTGFTYQYVKDSNEYGFNCGNCHPEDSSKHGNGLVDIELFPSNSPGLKKLNGKDALYDKAKKTCSWVYCHSSGGNSLFLEYRETPSWGTSFGELRCQGCHGTPPSYESKKGRENSHFNSGRGSGHLLGIHWDSTNGHTKESLANKRSSDMGCSTCHYGTVREDKDMTFIDTVNGLFTCSRCHDNKTVMGKDRPGIIANKALHVNGIIEVSFSPEKFRTTSQLMNPPNGWKRSGDKGGPVSYDETIAGLNSSKYIPEEKKCMNVACHLLGKEVRWGDEIDCDSCHRDFGFRGNR